LISNIVKSEARVIVTIGAGDKDELVKTIKEAIR